MHTQIKAGILFCTSGWFRNVGIQNSTSTITKEVDKIAKKISQSLSLFSDVYASSVVFSADQAEREAEKIRSANIDVLIVAPLMWCEDQILRAALKKLPRLPIILCTFLPSKNLQKPLSFHQMLKGSGAVASLQYSGMLKREGYTLESLTGWYEDEKLYQKISRILKILSIQKKLSKTICGVIPFRCDQMSATYIDEFKLRKLYGVELKYIELSAFKNEAQNISETEINTFLQLLKSSNTSIEVEERSLKEGIKYAIAMEKIARKFHLNIIAINDVIEETHNTFGLRPCLTNPQIFKNSTVVSMEADIGAGIAMYILHLLTGFSPFYTEIFNIDLDNNAFLMGHAGYHDTTHHDTRFPIKIIPDVEYKNSDPFMGACTFFKYQPGPVTAVNSIFDGEKLKWITFEGVSSDEPPFLEGNAHLLCKLNIPVKKLFNTMIGQGVSHHWIIIPGHIEEDIPELCKWLDIKHIPISTLIV